MVFLTLLLNIVSASFEIGEASHNLTYTNYNPGETIKGWINISFNNESKNSVFNDSLGNSISLIDLLEKDDNLTYTLENENVTADFQKIYLDEGNFFLPENYGNLTFKLNFINSAGSFEIFSEKINITDVPIIKSLTPTTTVSAFPTVFEVEVESVKNITEYEWNFGDNKTETTETNKITHIYEATGWYELKITVTNSEEFSTYRIFNINVDTPTEIINTTLKKMQKDLTNLKNQISEFDLFHQECLNSALGIGTLENKLTTLQKEFLTEASSEEDILIDLLVLKIPESILISGSADSIPLYIETSNINLNALKEIGGGNYNISDKNKYVDAIQSWNIENMETKISFEEISAKYEFYEESVLRIFELKIDKKNSSEEDIYFILKKIGGLNFKGDYSEKEGYAYIELGSANTITFSTTENVEFTDIPFFVSPEINKLAIIKDDWYNEDEEKGKIPKDVLFILILVLLLIIGIVSYIILQEWYKRKYENHLFKNKNDLHNLVMYIENSKNKGLKIKEVAEKLKKAGWKSEQINYAVKKHSGKRTGMFEIPIGKIFNIFKKKKI
jgi:PKD repeat protein